MRRAWRRIRGSSSRSAGNVPPEVENTPAETSIPTDSQPDVTAPSGRRATVPRRRRVGRSGEFAELDAHIDQNLGPDKELIDFRVLPGDEVHISTCIDASVSLFYLLNVNCKY